MTRIAVVGGGAWGTALADLLARKGEQVTLWAREPEVVDSVNQRHVNDMFLPGAPLAATLAATRDSRAVVKDAQVIVSAAQSHAVRPVMHQVAGSLSGKPLVISASKGLDPEKLERPSAVLLEVLPAGTPIAVLSGPSFALEVYQRQPTAVVAAATDHAVAERAQRLFSTPHFRVYSHTDVIGVELGGALKNVIALAAALARTQAVVEGVNTARTAVALGELHGVELPIAREVANVLFQNKPPRQAVSDLMERELKAESR